MVLLLATASTADQCDPPTTSPRPPTVEPSCSWEGENRYEAKREKPVDVAHKFTTPVISLAYDRSCLKFTVERVEGDCTAYWVDQNKDGAGERAKDFMTGNAIEQQNIAKEPNKEWHLKKGDYYIHFAPSPCVKETSAKHTKAIVSVKAGNWK